MTLKQLKRELARHGATIDKCGSGAAFVIDAPPGKTWVAGQDLHSLVVCLDSHFSGMTVEEAYQDAADRMAGGLEDCVDPDCCVCG